MSSIRSPKRGCDPSHGHVLIMGVFISVIVVLNLLYNMSNRFPNIIVMTFFNCVQIKGRLLFNSLIINKYYTPQMFLLQIL